MKLLTLKKSFPLKYSTYSKRSEKSLFFGYVSPLAPFFIYKLSLTLMLPLMSWKNIIKWEINWLFFALNSFHLSSSNGVPFIYYQCVLSAVGWGCCQSPSRCHWLKTVRQKKVAGDICFPERKKNPPHQCKRRRQRQTSAQSCGSHWLALCTKSNSNHFTHNTPTNPKGVHAASLLHSAAVATLQNLM